MSNPFRPAERTKATPLVALYGERGSGKTYSALMLARGFVGETGKIAMLDPESGRGELYADEIEGGYDVLQIGAPFDGPSYIEGIKAAEGAKYDVLVIDSASHEWEGIGGVLSQAEAIEARSGKTGLHCWKKPKAQHQLFVLKLLQSRIPIILCLRSKYKSNQKGGKVIKDSFLSATQAPAFVFEMKVKAEIERDTHKINRVKKNHPALDAVFVQGHRIDYDTGKRLAQWASEGKPAPEKTDMGDIDVEGLMASAEFAAEGGRTAFEAFWKPLNPNERDVVSIHLDDLKATFMAADSGLTEAFQKEAAE